MQNTYFTVVSVTARPVVLTLSAAKAEVETVALKAKAVRAFDMKFILVCFSMMFSPLWVNNDLMSLSQRERCD